MSALPLLQAVTRGALPRHRHREAYAAVVLAGTYEEAGDRGRRQVGPGDVVVHEAWEAHLNRTPPRGARVLNLNLSIAGLAPFGRVSDPDALVRLAERDPAKAAQRLAETFLPANDGCADWPDLLAAALGSANRTSLGAWATTLGVSPEHLSRGFRKAYGVTPQRYRWEARNRAALREVAESTVSLAELALTHGFADQAHLTRSLRLFAGATPAALRRSNPFKTTG